MIPQYQLICGDGAAMAIVGDGEADLIVTSPPYFAPRTARWLEAPRRAQTEHTLVWEQVREDAEALAPVFREMARVLRPGGAAVVQTKDLRYGEALLPLAALHRDLAERAGLRLVSRVFWHRIAGRQSRSASFRRCPRVGSFEADDVEEFQVLAHPGGIITRDAIVELPTDELAACRLPVWTFPAPGNTRSHPYGSPPRLVRRFVALYSAPGDLVVDPFAGHGTTLREALRLGRRAVGYELDAAIAAEGDRRVLAACLGLNGARR